MELFRGDHADLGILEINRRRQFVHRVLLPAALSVMSTYEQMEPYAYRDAGLKTLPELIDDFDEIPKSTLDYLAASVREETGNEINWSELQVSIDLNKAREAVHETLGSVIENLGEAINHFDCDIVLLSGRPSQLPAINEMMVDTLAIPPDRLVAMHRYRPGPWYPYLERNGVRIADPKTTAVVGGTICALADRRIRNFMVYTDKLQMRSTAKYIGILESNGKLSERDVLFDNATLESLRRPAAAHPVDYYTRMTIGYRQLPFERWAATPFYELHETRGGNPIPKPVSVVFCREEVETRIDDDPTRPDDTLRALLDREASREGLMVESAMHLRDHSDFKESLRLTFRTLDSNASYWLDTGTLWNQHG